MIFNIVLLAGLVLFGILAALVALRDSDWERFYDRLIQRWQDAANSGLVRATSAEQAIEELRQEKRQREWWRL